LRCHVHPQYWTRTWILQELLSARWPVLVYGTKKAAWEAWIIFLDTLER
jgi:hypothetical protein